MSNVKNGLELTIEKNKDGVPVLQIGDDMLVLDPDTDAKYMLSRFRAVTNPDMPCIPSTLVGCCIMYDNGIIAATVSVGKLTDYASEFIMIISYMFPGMDGYKTARFYVTRSVLDGFIKALA